MKCTLLLAMICLVLAGCGTYSETRITTLSSPPKTIALGEFKSNNIGIAQLFADTVAVQLTAAGFQVVAYPNQADVVITGSVSYIVPNYAQSGSSNWILMIETKEGQILGTIGCDVIGQKESNEVISEMAKRLVNYLQGKVNK
jgi:hypothetical protein